MLKEERPTPVPFSPSPSFLFLFFSVTSLTLRLQEQNSMHCQLYQLPGLMPSPWKLPYTHTHGQICTAHMDCHTSHISIPPLHLCVRASVICADLPSLLFVCEYFPSWWLKSQLGQYLHWKSYFCRIWLQSPHSDDHIMRKSYRVGEIFLEWKHARQDFSWASRPPRNPSNCF